jgi:TRAP transporter 4TM/12TM fusion protein
MLTTFGATDFFIEFGKIIGSKFRSGPAMTAVVSSALVGMLSGSAVANVGMVGVFTIPLMKKMGYRPEMAGAIEAAASSGGQIMPPVMGAAAFLMAEMIGVPYIYVCAMAAIPAILYYFTVGTYVALQAGKLNVNPVVEKADTRKLLTRAPLFIVPLILLTVLLIDNRSPMFAIFWTIVAIIILGCIRKDTRPSWSKFVKGVSEGAIGGAQIGVSSACIGIVVATMTMTGLAFKLAGIVEAISGGSLLVALIITMIVSLILGCGVPTIAAYMIVAIGVCPALVKLGADLYAAHFFNFFFAIFSAVTPPVAMASLVASAIAGSPYIKTAVESCKVAVAGFLLPYLIIFCPSLILQFSNPLDAAMQIAATTLLCFVFSILLLRYYFSRLNKPELALVFISCIIFGAYAYTHNTMLFILGVCLFIFISFQQWRKRSHPAKVAVDR